MIDINKAISDLEESIGRRLTDEEKFNIALFDKFMNKFWANTEQNDSDLNPDSPPEEEIKPMSIGEVIDGLDYCLSTGKCSGCANSEGRMVATCRPLVENALKFLRTQHKAIMDLTELLKQENEHNRKLMDEFTNLLLKKH